MNVQLICDATYVLQNIMAQWPGGIYGAILCESEVGGWSCLYLE